MKLVLVLLASLTPLSAIAQDTLSTLPVDSSNVSIRPADAQTLQQINDDKAFAYNEEAQNPESLWSRIKRWIIQTLALIFQNKWASVFIKLAFFIAFGIILIALINQLLGGNMQLVFSKSRDGKELFINPSEINSEKIDLDEMLKKAIASNQFSEAVRILYLQALQELNHIQLISIKRDKTNYDYLNELGNHPSSPLFKRLTTYYQYVEYGDFTIEKSGFETIRDVYKQFKSNLSSQK